MVKVRSVQHSVKVEKGPKQTNQCTQVSVLTTLQKSDTFFCGSTISFVRLHQFFSIHRFGHIIHGANILLTIAQVSSKITLRDFSRGVLVYFCPPPRSCHCLAGPSVTLSIGSAHGVLSEWAGSQYACQCIDNVKFGVNCLTYICCAHYTRACAQVL